VKTKKAASVEAALWRQRSFEVQRSEVVAGRLGGPEPPRAWARRLRQLVDATRRAEEGPAWWTPIDAYFGNVETRSDPRGYLWDGMKRLGRRDQPLVFFQFTLAGFGHYETYGRPAQRIPPGTGFFAVVPSRHRYYLPEASPGWTFAWIGIYHPYLLRRITKQVAVTGPIVQAAPSSPLVARLMRLVRGAFHKDFRDRFAVEAELFGFMHAFERSAQAVPSAAAEHVLEDLRARIAANPRVELDVAALAAEQGMTRSAFGHQFRARTGATPARFMTEVRVQEAARLLVTTRWPLARIAAACGFANENHFGKVFRRFRHLSAGAYRRSLT